MFNAIRSSVEAIEVSGRALAEMRSAASATMNPNKPAAASSRRSVTTHADWVLNTSTKPSIVKASSTQRRMAHLCAA